MRSNSLTLFALFTILTSCKNNSSDINNIKEEPQKNILERKIVDLSHDYSSETIYWVTAKEFKLDTVFNGKTDQGFYYSANNFETAEHGGTHIDAPIHFSENSETVDQIPLEKLVGKAIKIDVSEKTISNPDYLISIEDLMNWETKEGIQIPNESIVLLETGFSKFYPDVLKYLGTDKRGPEAVKELHFPGLSPEAATWIIENRNIKAIGIDTASIDYGQSQNFQTHVNLMSHNISAFENLTNLNKLPSKGFHIVALPMKIKGGSGAPLRIVAFIN
ncbi:cyclase family protein [Yeosuana sp. MJ-SS3]|uniref:Cyclase family protein n=1 Tax=Gilvirhabdus luticola TaxID=3079858 RepID=A0ABU3U5C4_9FLAO|nr:cyclase family protein [Yeosuana sp. MJ-SS3]MDU8885603.1 cyclase family protein [Yeosuana sp. MJ-SS3]